MTDGTRLRGHHFICLHFFEGQGYDEEFVANLTEVVARWRQEPAALVTGADDVCAACPNLSAYGTCVDPASGEAEIARIDALACEVLGMHPGDRLGLAQAAERLADDAAAGRWRFEACDGCGFEAVCEPGWKRLAGR